jgi:xylulokinase
VLDLPVGYPEGGDFGAAFGAARLGLMAATPIPSPRSHAAGHAKERSTPTRASQAFDETHARYRAALSRNQRS